MWQQLVDTRIISAHECPPGLCEAFDAYSFLWRRTIANTYGTHGSDIFMVTEQPEATDMTAEPLGRTAMLTGTHEGMQEIKDVIKLVEAIRQLAGPDPVQVDITLRVAKVIG